MSKKWLKKTTNYPDKPSSNILQSIPFTSERASSVSARMCSMTMKFDEFTSLCPITHQPDFASLSIQYQPVDKCIESKALKIYLFSYRNFGCFGEQIANRILHDIKNCIKPRYIKVIIDFAPRGGIPIHIELQEYDNSK